MADALRAKERVARRLFTPNKPILQAAAVSPRVFNLRKTELEKDTLSDIIMGDKDTFYKDPLNSNELDLVDMPKTTIPSFDGNPLHALDFWESFRVGVHLKRIPIIKKLQLLRNYTVGPVFNSIKSYPIIPENYKVALITVYVKFCEPKKLVQCYYAMLHLIGVSNDNTYSLRTTLENVSVLISNLTILKENINTYPLGMEVRNKFPLSIVEKINELCPINEVETSLEILDEIISNKEMALHLKNPLKSLYPQKPKNYGHPNYENKNQNFSKKNYKQKQNHSFSNNFVESSDSDEPNALGEGPKPHNPQRNNNYNRNKRACLFCNGDNHYTSDCRVYPGYNERINQLGEQNRCFACLAFNHKAFQCTNPKTCFYCKGQHPSILCKKYLFEFQNKSTIARSPIQQNKKSVKFRNNNEEFEYNSNNPQQSESDSDDEDQPSSSIVHAHSYVEYPQTIPIGITKESILQSVNVELTNPNKPGLSTTGLCLLDSGCQKTFILSSVSKILKLPGKNTNLTLYTFGSDIPEEFKCKNVKINIALSDGTQKLLHAHTKELLSRPIKTIPISETDLEKIQREKSTILSLNNKNVSPIMIIGMDYYHDFINSETNETHLNNGYRILHTSLGPILSGHGRLTVTSDQTGSDAFIALNDNRKEVISDSLSKSTNAIDWKEEYFNEIINEYRNVNQKPFLQQNFSPKLNDVVLIKGDDEMRDQWKTGVITELHPGKIQTATVKTTLGNSLMRPIHSLCSLEIYSQTNTQESTNNKAINNNQQQAQSINEHTKSTCFRKASSLPFNKFTLVTLVSILFFSCVLSQSTNDRQTTKGLNTFSSSTKTYSLLEEVKLINLNASTIFDQFSKKANQYYLWIGDFYEPIYNKKFTILFIFLSLLSSAIMLIFVYKIFLLFFNKPKKENFVTPNKIYLLKSQLLKDLELSENEKIKQNRSITKEQSKSTNSKLNSSSKSLKNLDHSKSRSKSEIPHREKAKSHKE